MFKSRGPYRVLEPANPGSYIIQKLPFLDNLGSMGRRIKESAARMERNPSTLVIHKRPDGADTRMASMRHPLVNNPVQKWLGAIDSGAYRPAAPNENQAFVKIEDMWSDPIDESDDEEEIETETIPIAQEPPTTRADPPTVPIYLPKQRQTMFLCTPTGRTDDGGLVPGPSQSRKNRSGVSKRTW